jgi:menaquinone-9 beta-reductase
VNREKYDFTLLSIAQAIGVPTILGDPVIDFKLKESKLYLKSGKIIETKIVVGADGVNSLIRKSIYSQNQFKINLGIAFQTVIPKGKLNIEYENPSVQLFLGINKYGYGWVFPHSETYMIGMGGVILKDKNIKSKFLSFLSTLCNEFADKPPKIKAHLVPYGDFLKVPGGNNTLLIGDAAGFVDPFTGEGIYFAHQTALIASQIIIDFFKTHNRTNLATEYSKKLVPYYKKLAITKRFRWFFFNNFYFATNYYFNRVKIN